jgi:hypothetical protein
MTLCEGPFVLKIASHNLIAVAMASARKSGAGMTSTSPKHTAVLHSCVVWRSRIFTSKWIRMQFRDIMTWERLEIICKFLHFIDNESNSNFEGQEKLFKMFPVISHLNNKFQELYLPNQDRAVWHYHRLFMVLPCIYRQGDEAWLPLDHCWHQQNISHCSETGWTPVETRPDCVEGQFL